MNTIESINSISEAFGASINKVIQNYFMWSMWQQVASVLAVPICVYFVYLFLKTLIPSILQYLGRCVSSFIRKMWREFILRTWIWTSTSTKSYAKGVYRDITKYRVMKPVPKFSLASLAVEAQRHMVGISLCIHSAYESTDWKVTAKEIAKIFSFVGIEQNIMRAILGYGRNYEDNMQRNFSRMQEQLDNNSFYTNTIKPESLSPKLAGGFALGATVMDLNLNDGDAGDFINKVQRNTQSLQKIGTLVEDFGTELGLIENDTSKLLDQTHEIIEEVEFEKDFFETLVITDTASIFDSLVWQRWCALELKINILRDHIRNLTSMKVAMPNLLQALSNIRMSCDKLAEKIKQLRNCKKERVEPTGVIISGPSGIGKTILQNHLVKAIKSFVARTPKYMSVLGDISHWTIWPINPRDEYDEGYKMDKITIQDDAFANSDNEDHKQWLPFISSAPALTKQASLTNKGSPYVSELVILSCNNLPTKSCTINNFNALERRFPIHVKASLKKGAKRPTGEMDETFKHLKMEVQSWEETAAGDIPKEYSFDQLVEAIVIKMCEKKKFFYSNQRITSESVDQELVESYKEYHKTHEWNPDSPFIKSSFQCNEEGKCTHCHRDQELCESTEEEQSPNCHLCPICYTVVEPSIGNLLSDIIITDVDISQEIFPDWKGKPDRALLNAFKDPSAAWENLLGVIFLMKIGTMRALRIGPEWSLTYDVSDKNKFSELFRDKTHFEVAAILTKEEKCRRKMISEWDSKHPLDCLKEILETLPDEIYEYGCNSEFSVFPISQVKPADTFEITKLEKTILEMHKLEFRKVIKQKHVFKRTGINITLRAMSLLGINTDKYYSELDLGNIPNEKTLIAVGYLGPLILAALGYGIYKMIRKYKENKEEKISSEADQPKSVSKSKKTKTSEDTEINEDETCEVPNAVKKKKEPKPGNQEGSHTYKKAAESEECNEDQCMIDPQRVDYEVALRWVAMTTPSNIKDYKELGFNYFDYPALFLLHLLQFGTGDLEWNQRNKLRFIKGILVWRDEVGMPCFTNKIKEMDFWLEDLKKRRPRLKFENLLALSPYYMTQMIREVWVEDLDKFIPIYFDNHLKWDIKNAEKHRRWVEEHNLLGEDNRLLKLESTPVKAEAIGAYKKDRNKKPKKANARQLKGFVKQSDGQIITPESFYDKPDFIVEDQDLFLVEVITAQKFPLTLEYGYKDRVDYQDDESKPKELVCGQLGFDLTFIDFDKIQPGQFSCFDELFVGSRLVNRRGIKMHTKTLEMCFLIKAPTHELAFALTEIKRNIEKMFDLGHYTEYMLVDSNQPCECTEGPDPKEDCKLICERELTVVYIISCLNARDGSNLRYFTKQTDTTAILRFLNGTVSEFQGVVTSESHIENEAIIHETAFAQFDSVRAKNEVFCYSIETGMSVYGLASGDTIITNNHIGGNLLKFWKTSSLPAGSSRNLSSYYAKLERKSAAEDIRKWKILPAKEVPVGENYLKEVPTFPDISNLFLTGEELAKIDNEEVVHCLPKSQKRNVSRASYMKNLDMRMSRGEEVTSLNLIKVVGDTTASQEGDCGGFVMTTSQRRSKFIIGIHTGKSLTTFWVSPISREFLTEEITNESDQKIWLQGQPTDLPPGPDVVFKGQYFALNEPIHKKKSSYKESPFILLNDEKHLGLPVLEPDDPRIKVPLPTNLNGKPSLLLKQTSIYAKKLPTMSVRDKHVLQLCVSDLTKYLTLKMRNMRKRPQFNTIEEEIEYGLNGHPDNQFVKNMYLNSSIGEPHSHILKGVTKKSDVIKIVKDRQRETLKLAEDRNGYYIKKVMVKKIENMKQGIVIHSICKNSLKDEPVKHSNIDIGKTRVFTAVPIELTLVDRLGLGDFLEEFIKLQLEVNHVMGINSHSGAVALLYDYLNAHPNCFDADYSNYDKHLSEDIMLACEDVIINTISNIHGPSDTVFLRALFLEFRQSLMLDYTTGYYTRRGNKSGIASTTLINNICNMLYNRFAFIKTTGDRSWDNYVNNVRCIFQGDDALTTVSDEYPKFNYISYKRVLESLGHQITPGIKESEGQRYIPLSDAIFCQRQFRFMKGRVVMPLNRKSIYSPLQFSKMEHSDIGWKECLSNLLFEASLHGEDFYNIIKQRISTCTSPRLLQYIETILVPNWEQKIDQYIVLYDKNEFYDE